MSSKINKATIHIRGATAAEWTSDNPTPKSREWCLETDTGYTKMGDGSTAWTSLRYNIGTSYEDLQVSISNIKIPAANEPADRLYNHGIVGGVTFPVLGFAVGEYVYFDLQTQHSMKLNTILDNHIHYMTPTDGSGTPDRFQFQLDVIVAPIGGSWAVPTGSPFTSEHTISDDYTNSHELMEIADIPASNSTVSTIYKCKLTRIAASQDEYSGEVYLEFTDSHFQKDTLGSRLEGSK